MGELGSWLVRAREARGLTLEDAERDTRISRRYLQALEAEQFEVIPAPVYARGFLRSYSQYLGLDPEDMLALFPREDEPGYPGGPTSSVRASPQQPLSAVGASRPAWRRPDRAQSQATGARPFDGAPEPIREPTIGIDIGVPLPSRRIKSDPAAQARAITVLVAAVAGVVAVILLALLISRVGGSDAPPGNSGSLAGAATATARAVAAAATATITPLSGGSGLLVTPGVVPDVTGEQVDIARAAITEAGFKVREQSEPSSQPKGAVLQQSPAAGVELQEGLEVRIVVSAGP